MNCSEFRIGNKVSYRIILFKFVNRKLLVELTSQSKNLYQFSFYVFLRLKVNKKLIIIELILMCYLSKSDFLIKSEEIFFVNNQII